MSNLFNQVTELLLMLGVLAGVAFGMFAILGPIIQMALDYALPPDDWDDDDSSAA